MTEQISFPPLHDLSPGELERRKQHLLSEIRREPEWRRLSLPTIPRLRLRFALPVAAAVCAATVGAVVLSGALGGSGTHRPGQTAWSAQGTPDAAFPWLTTNVNRSGQGVASVNATVQAPWPGATAQIYVIRNPNYEQVQGDGSGLTVGPDGGQIVFQEQTSLTDLTARPNPPADDRWSSTVTLNPSQWDGGCQNAPYGIYVLIGHPSDPKNSAQSGSSWFTCTPGSSGRSK